ncbi:7-carboxy-7-deazaguanine synthase QueE [Planctomycetota bacterium]
MKPNTQNKKVPLPGELVNETVLLVQEDPLFISPQGEGKYMGRLSAWVRCTTCNLRCAWANPDGSVTLCDTSYSSHLPSYERQAAQAVYDYLIDSNAPHVVVTGGEPTRQAALLRLIDFIEASGKRVTVETNGTHFFASNATLISLSPKLSSSGAGLKLLSNPNYCQNDTDGFLEHQNSTPALRAQLYAQYRDIHDQHRYVLKPLRATMDFYGPERYQFKFVAHSEDDLAEILEKYIAPLAIPPQTVYLMPQGITHEQLQERAAWVIEKCIKHGFHYSDRLHIRIYGNQTGV